MKNIITNLKDKYLFYLVNLKKTLFGDYGKKYFSQSGEDIILSNLFKNQPQGFYVDIGAFHPTHYSNTYLLYKKGWSGINVDPNPISIKLFNARRKRDINIQAGVASKSEEKKYYVFNHQSCNTFSEIQKEEMMKKSYIKLIGTETISCLPLKNILENHLTLNKKIDLMSIDTEGYDLEVLKSNDWQKFAPEVVVVERPCANFETIKDDPIYMFLKEKKYKLNANTGLSLVFTKINHE